MKIALFHNLPSGGAKRALYELTFELSQKCLVDLYTFKETENFLPISKFCKNTYFFKLPAPINFIKYQEILYKKILILHKNIAQKINEKNYDVVFVNHDFYTKAPYILRFLKIPSVYLCHEPPREFYENISLYSNNIKYKLVNLLRFPLKKIDYYNARKADLILANSNYSVRVLSRIYKYKVRLLKLGVNTKIFHFMKCKRGNFFMTVGALSNFKGYEFLIQTIGNLPSKYKLPLIAIASGGRDEKYIRRLANRLNVRLIIKKKLSDAQLVRLYNKAKLFLFAAISEPLGLSILEASACGLPTVAIKEGGVGEVINKTNGILVNRNEDSFREGIMKLYNENFNIKRRNKIARNIKKNWSWRNSGLKLQKYLLEVIR